MGYAKCRVALVDNDPLTLSLLMQRLPQWVPGIDIAWHTDSGSTAIRRCLNADLSPDVLLLDLSLKEHEYGVSICRSIRVENASTWILGMTSYSLRHYAADLAAAGAQGIVSKGDLRMFALALNVVSHRNVFNPLEESIPFLLPPVAHDRIVERNERKKSRLSPQEELVLDLLSRGYDYASISKELGVQQSSIRTQAHRAVKKMHANTLGHALVLWVMRNAG